MPGFLNNPSSIISQIKSNLQDRYGSGYPILKELLQNADDAKANRFRLDALLQTSLLSQHCIVALGFSP